MPSLPLSEADWEEWMQHPGTKALNEWLDEEREDLKEQWASGLFTDQSQYATAILNAKAIGKLEAFELIAELNYSQLMGDLTDGQHREVPAGSAGGSEE